ncbi:ATP synthase F1 subunit gamma [Halalkalibaculum sp. DA384]|uniref:ATP synthase F1 subunit gamma n=1 Tax=Halalkalibaculum sp. DA384 TaxID=3373606 RepID=UPI00375492FF
MANLRDIRNRIESIKNTQQITRAMKMVAAAKLRKAQNRIIETRPYASKMKEVVGRLVKNAGDQNILLRKPEKTEKVLFIVISSDRGLCGAFNNNLFKKVQATIEEDFSTYREQGDLSLITLGKKGTKHFGKRGYELSHQDSNFFDNLEYTKPVEVMKKVVADFKAGNVDAVYLAYNEFKSVIAQNRIIEPVLPIDPSKLAGEDTSESIDYIYEPGVESILDDLLPLHLNMQLWKAILESNAAEQGARMTAMDNATENAKELERDLQLEYNQARQSAITTEISEIVSGAQALEEA